MVGLREVAAFLRPLSLRRSLLRRDADVQASRRREDLGRVLAWFGTQAGRLQDPASLDRVARGLDRARELLVVVQRDLDRQAPEREADGER